MVARGDRGMEIPSEKARTLRARVCGFELHSHVGGAVCDAAGARRMRFE